MQGINQVKHMYQTFASIIETMGGRVTSRPFEPKAGDFRGGFIIHEAGTVRMGADPKTVCAQQIFAVARSEKSICVRRGAVCEQSG